MSNLIKYVYFNSNEDKRVIDSDVHVEELVPELFTQPEETENADDTFQSGLNVISMDDVMEEERQKLSEELILQQNEILDAAHAEADRIVEEANGVAESIKQQAYEEGVMQGIDEGRKQGMVEIEEQKRQLQEEFDYRIQQLEDAERNLEPKFAEIVAGLVEKITGVVCKDKKDVIIYLIDNALHGIERAKQITVRVNKNDMGVVTENRGKFLKAMKSDIEFEIVEDVSLEQNQCIIETENKIIDCSLDAQLDNLKEQLKMLSM